MAGDKYVLRKPYNNKLPVYNNTLSHRKLTTLFLKLKLFLSQDLCKRPAGCMLRSIYNHYLTILQAFVLRIKKKITFRSYFLSKKFRLCQKKLL